MFEKMRNRLRDTIQIEVESTSLEPEISDGESRQFHLVFRDGSLTERYPCTKKAWESWASRVLKPKDKKQWQISSIRHFLEHTKASLANKVVRSWWDDHQPQLWHLIKYKNKDSLGEIRYIGSKKYQLYTNDSFLEDLSHAKFDNMSIKTQMLCEDFMLFRVLDNEKLKIDDKSLFSGFHIINSENGSSSVVVRHMIYDLVCLNGLMDIIDSRDMIHQQHIRFDRKIFREKVTKTALNLPEFHKQSTTFIKQLATLVFTQKDAGSMLQKYKDLSGVSDTFIDEVGSDLSKSPTAWEIISGITRKAQDYNWMLRSRLEAKAGVLAGQLPSWRRQDVIVN